MVAMEDFGSCTIKIEKVKTACRWCGKEFDRPTLYVVGSAQTCPHCKASQVAALTFHSEADDKDIAFWHNPDNSLFIEFIGQDGKTARYLLSAEQLMKTGMLQLFDQNPNGRR
jgi:hypothetical protein